MAIRSTILSGVDTAFNVLGDLVVRVTLTQRDATRYDFATGRTVVSSSGTTVIDGVLLAADKRSEDGNRVMDTLILKARDAPNFDIYDNITIGTKTYRIESFENNGFAIEVQVSGG